MMEDKALDSWTVFKNMPFLGCFRMPLSEVLSKASVYLRNMEEHSDDLDTGEVNLLETVNPQRLIQPFFLHFEELKMPPMPASKRIYKAATFALGSYDHEFFQIVYINIKSKQTPEGLFDILKSILKFLKDAGKIHNLLAIIADRNETNSQLVNCGVPILWDLRHLRTNLCNSRNEPLLNAYDENFYKDTYNTQFQDFILQNSTYFAEEYNNILLGELTILNQIVEKLFLYVPNAPEIRLGYCNNEYLKRAGRMWIKGLGDFLKMEKRAVNEIEREFPKIFPRVLGILAHFTVLACGEPITL